MKQLFVATVACLAAALPAHAALVNVDLGTATTGALIDGVGADFAQSFDGQAVAGITLVGTPNAPLALAPAGSITVGFFDPGVSAASNSLLPQPGNSAPLAMLLDDDADSLTLTMGSSSSGTITIDFYTDLGILQNSVTQALAPSGYDIYTFSGLGTFRGVAFRDNTDASGLRFMNLSYNSVDADPVPAPGALGLLGLGLLAMAGRVRRA